MITAGASEALTLALTCVGDPGDAVALPRPAFPGYDELAALLGLRVAHYDASGSTRIAGAPALQDAPRDDEASVVARLIGSPHNPTGAVSARSRYRNKEQGDAWSIWDLSHAPLPAPESIARTPLGMFRDGLQGNEILVFSLSKLLRLPGARIGCLICADPQLIDTVTRVKTHLSMSTSRPSQILAARLLNDHQARADITAHHELITARRDLLQRAISASTCLRAPVAQGGSHLMLYSLDPADSSDPWKTLKAAGFVGLPGSVFHSPTPAVGSAPRNPTPSSTRQPRRSRGYDESARTDRDRNLPPVGGGTRRRLDRRTGTPAACRRLPGRRPRDR